MKTAPGGRRRGKRIAGWQAAANRTRTIDDIQSEVQTLVQRLRQLLDELPESFQVLGILGLPGEVYLTSDFGGSPLGDADEVDAVLAVLAHLARTRAEREAARLLARVGAAANA